MSQPTAAAAEEFKAFEHRFEARTNPVGLGGVDHVGVPARDPLLAGRFVKQILGGVEFIKAGYSAEDIRLGRPRHIFFQIGSLVYEVAQQSDESGYSQVATKNDQPHLAFGTTAKGLLEFGAHLRANGIRFDGPCSHRGMSACSVYFRDPDHKHLEVTTWEAMPEGTTQPDGRTAWLSGLGATGAPMASQTMTDVRILAAGANWLRIGSMPSLGLTGYHEPLGKGSTASVHAMNTGESCILGMDLVDRGVYDLGMTSPPWLARAAAEARGFFGWQPRQLQLSRVCVFPHHDQMVFAVRKDLAIKSLHEIREHRLPLRLSSGPHPLSHPYGYVLDLVLADMA